MESMLDTLSQRKGMSKSEVIKQALAMYFEKEKASVSPYELGKDLFGSAQGGDEEASSSYKRRVKEKLHGKHTH